MIGVRTKYNNTELFCILGGLFSEEAINSLNQ